MHKRNEREPKQARGNETNAEKHHQLDHGRGPPTRNDGEKQPCHALAGASRITGIYPKCLRLLPFHIGRLGMKCGEQLHGAFVRSVRAGSRSVLA